MASIPELVSRGRALLTHPGIGGEVEQCCERDGLAELAWLRLKQGLTLVFDEMEGRPRPIEPDAGPLSSTF
jgi:hypothetical protein